MIDVGDDGDVSDVVSAHDVEFFLRRSETTGYNTACTRVRRIVYRIGCDFDKPKRGWCGARRVVLVGVEL